MPTRGAWEALYGGGGGGERSFWKIVDGKTHYILPRERAASFEAAEGLSGIRFILGPESFSLGEVPSGKSVYSEEGENVIEHSLNRPQAESLKSALRDYFYPGRLGEGQLWDEDSAQTTRHLPGKLQKATKEMFKELSHGQVMSVDKERKVCLSVKEGSQGKSYILEIFDNNPVTGNPTRREVWNSLDEALCGAWSVMERNNYQFMPRRLYRTETENFQETDSLGDAIIYIEGRPCFSN